MANRLPYIGQGQPVVDSNGIMTAPWYLFFSTLANLVNTNEILQSVNNLSDVDNITQAFNNISPLKTGGDLIVSNGGNNAVRLPPGTIGQVLTVTNTTNQPLGWA